MEKHCETCICGKRARVQGNDRVDTMKVFEAMQKGW